MRREIRVECCSLRDAGCDVVIDNNANDTPQPTSPATSPITVIAAGAGNGGAHACAVQGGSLMCWGYNKYGQLGDGTTNDRAMPVAVHW